MNFPIVVVNGGTTPYTGTTVSGFPMPQGVLFTELNIVAAAKDGSGKTYPASHTILTRHPDGSAKWVLTAVTGTFEVGETRLDVLIDPNGSRGTGFVPKNYQPSINSGMKIVYVDFSTGEQKIFILDFALLDQYYSTTHYSTKNHMLFEWFGPVSGNLCWRLFSEHREGETGARIEFIIENRGPGFHDKGQPLIIKEATIWHRQSRPTEPAPSFPWGSQFSQSVSRYGELAVAHGKECCPLYMGYDDSTGVVYAQWITPDTRIPQGKNYAPLTFPGDMRNPSDVQQIPESDLGDFIYEKRSVRFFIGGALEQEHLDHPPMMIWEDCERYDAFLVGGISPVEPWKDDLGKPMDATTLQRFERRTAAAWDPAACTPFTGTNERITRTLFRERGGTYARTPDQNPMYGSFNYGDMQWGDGKSGAAHYDIDHALLYQFLRSRDFRVWKESDIALKHLRTVDFQWGPDSIQPTTKTKQEGLSGYEKGQQHGNYGLGNITHTWLNGAGLAYCLTGHPEFLRLMRHAAYHLVTYEHLDGGAVPANWARGTSLDPRDWGSTGSSHRYGTSNGGSAAWGYQGDWGIRQIGRVFEVATAIKVYVGSEVSQDIDAFYLRVLNNVRRVETGVWGGNGYILNRAQRSGHRYDYEQGWMHGYVVRGLGYALIYGPPEAQQYRDLYNRMYDRLMDYVVYGQKDPATGNWVPPRLTATFDESGPMSVVRYGIMPNTVNLWYPWRDSVLQNKPKQAAFDAWKTAVLADYQSMLSYVSPAGQHAWLLDDPTFTQYIDTVNRVTYDIDQNHADFVYLYSKQWAYTLDAHYPNINHCAIGADALAQGVLELGREDGELSAVRLAEHAQWHLQDGTTPVAYAQISNKASDVSWRMSMYPNSESKVNADQLEDRYQRRILGQLNKVAPFWHEGLTDIPAETIGNPWASTLAMPAGISTDLNGRVDVISADPSVPGNVVVVTTAALNGTAAPVVLD